MNLWVWNTLFNGLARFGLFGWKPCRMERVGDLWRASFTDSSALYFVSSRRFRLYGFGYHERLQRVAGRYGAGMVFQIGAGETVVEVGANVGEFSLYAAHHGARVYSIEPDRRNLAALRLNIAAHSNICIVAFACSDSTGEAVFYAYPEGADSSLVRPEIYSEQYTVATRRLDDWAAEAGIDTIDLLKCDAEGAEPEVLIGAQAILDRVRRITIDVSPERQGSSTAAECGELLKSAGFGLRRFHKGRILIGERP